MYNRFNNYIFNYNTIIAGKRIVDLFEQTLISGFSKRSIQFNY